MMVRVGIPKTTGALVKHAAGEGYPVMFSANAFRNKAGNFTQPSAIIQSMDAALDSAGFVAMKHYGGYPWSTDDYLELAAAAPWAWYASMDYCCEPEIARNQVAINERVRWTVDAYVFLSMEARERGLRPPMPVLQGWRAGDYLDCAEDIRDLPQLVGLGSVCRRSTSGVVSIIEALDRRLPKRTRLHLFGVKGEAAYELRGHERVASIDSMAWDFAARRKYRRVTNEKRIASMVEWRGNLLTALARPRVGTQLDMGIA